MIFVVRGASSKEVVSKIKYEKLKKILNERRTLFDSGLLGLKERCPGISSKFNVSLKSLFFNKNFKRLTSYRTRLKLSKNATMQLMIH